nr:hypothetical protein [Bacillus pumilus]
MLSFIALFLLYFPEDKREYIPAGYHHGDFLYGCIYLLSSDRSCV